VRNIGFSDDLFPMFDFAEKLFIDGAGYTRKGNYASCWENLSDGSEPKVMVGISATTRWALDNVHCASIRTASVLPVTITEATSKPLSSLKKTFVANEFSPCLLILTSIGFTLLKMLI
jgi:hypothetical protein